jgi:hypothetical protein
MSKHEMRRVSGLALAIGMIAWTLAAHLELAAQSQRPPNRDQPGIEAIVPNPLTHGITTIEFVLPVAGAFNVKIFALDGSLVASLIDEDSPSSGPRSVTWDGRSADGAPVANGMYFCRLAYGKIVRSKAVIVMR